MQKPVATNQIREEVMIHGRERILGWRLAASAFLQVAGFLWALGLSQNQTGMVLYRIPPPTSARTADISQTPSRKQGAWGILEHGVLSQ